MTNLLPVLVSVAIVTGAFASSSGFASFSNLTTSLPSAQDCLNSWSAYEAASISYEVIHRGTSTESFVDTYTQVETVSPDTTWVTSLTTLCDGHPRVVGQQTVVGGSSYTFTTTVSLTYTVSPQGTTYPGTPPTCSINTRDCISFYSSWYTQCFGDGQEECTTPQPHCSTTVLPSSSAAAPRNTTCNFCDIAAYGAQLLYWPVGTAQDHANLCSLSVVNATTCSSTGPTTEPSPTSLNIFVTGTLTITSPTVAVVFTSLSRLDGCGTTVDQTIVTVAPDQLSSVRGYHAFFSWYPFNYADLNWECATSDADNTTPYSERSDCYQAVPASVYFGGLQEAINIYFWPSSERASLTIYPNYQPQILIPETMDALITSLWGAGCSVQPDGVWDPPHALTAQTTIALPTVPSGYTNDPPSSTSAASPGSGLSSGGGQATPTTPPGPTLPNGVQSPSSSPTSTPASEQAGTGSGNDSGDHSSSGTPGVGASASDPPALGVSNAGVSGVGAPASNPPALGVSNAGVPDAANSAFAALDSGSSGADTSSSGSSKSDAPDPVTSQSGSGVSVGMKTVGSTTVEVIKVTYIDYNLQTGTQIFTVQDPGQKIVSDDVSIGSDLIVVNWGESQSTLYFTSAAESTSLSQATFISPQDRGSTGSQVVSQNPSAGGNNDLPLASSTQYSAGVSTPTTAGASDVSVQAPAASSSSHTSTASQRIWGGSFWVLRCMCFAVALIIAHG